MRIDCLWLSTFVVNLERMRSVNLGVVVLGLLGLLEIRINSRHDANRDSSVGKRGAAGASIILALHL